MATYLTLRRVLTLASQVVPFLVVVFVGSDRGCIITVPIPRDPKPSTQEWILRYTGLQRAQKPLFKGPATTKTHRSMCRVGDVGNDAGYNGDIDGVNNRDVTNVTVFTMT